MQKKVKKLIPVLLLFSIFLGVFLPFQNALAIDWWWSPSFAISEWVAEKITGVKIGDAGITASGIIAAIAGLIGGVAMTLLEFSQNLLNWVISPNFLGISMTGMDNPIIAEGWTRIRDLADIFLILATIIIAIGIILGIEEYKAKKTLPTLIIIGLLINFTPVICGWIIDFSNYLMKWALGVGGIHPSFQQDFETAMKGLEKNTVTETLFASLSYVIFGLVGTVVYLLYALLFLLRYIFLWILVAFSPIAFASRVFGPSTRIKKFFPGFLHWDQWWNDFLSWNVIGIFAAFFIFLTNALIKGVVLGGQITQTNPLGDFFLYLFPILLLLIGFFSTISMTQEAMTTTVPGMKEAVKTAGKTAGKVAGKAAKWTGKKVGEAIPEKVKEWGLAQARYMPSTANYGRGEVGLKGWGKRRLGQLGTTIVSPYTAARRGIGKVIGAGSKGQMDDAVRTIAELDGMTTEKVLEKYKTATIRGVKTGALYTLTQKHDLDDARGMMSEKERKQFNESVKKDMGEAAMVSRDLFMPIARSSPQYVDEVVEKLNPEIRKKMLLPEKDELVERGFVNEYGDKKGKASYGRYIISGMKGQHVGAMDAQVLFGSPEENKLKKEIQKKKNKGESVEDLEKELEKISQPRKECYDQIHKSWGGPHLEELFNTFKKPAVDTYMETAKKEKGALWYVVNNHPNASYLSSVFAPESGYFTPEGVTLPEVNDWKENLNKFDPEETKKFQGALEELPIEKRRDLTQCLRIDPNRTEELKGEDAAGIERKIEKWREEWRKEQEKGKVAESSAEEKIKQWENEIAEEERKIETGESPNHKRIRELNARIRKLKQKKLPDTGPEDVMGRVSLGPIEEIIRLDEKSSAATVEPRIEPIKPIGKSKPESSGETAPDYAKKQKEERLKERLQAFRTKNREIYDEIEKTKKYQDSLSIEFVKLSNRKLDTTEVEKKQKQASEKMQQLIDELGETGKKIGENE